MTSTGQPVEKWFWDELRQEIRSEGQRLIIASKYVVQDRDASLIAAAPELLEALDQADLDETMMLTAKGLQ